MMWFMETLPASAVRRDDSGDCYFTDPETGTALVAQPTMRTEPRTVTVRVKVTGEQYERVLDENGEVQTSKVIQQFHEARKLLAQCKELQRISFVAGFKRAYYQTQIPQAMQVQFEASVWNGLDDTRTFVGPDRSDVLHRALEYMDSQRDNATLNLKATKKVSHKTVITPKDTYEGRSNLSYVEVELSLSYMKKVYGWDIRPAPAARGSVEA